MRMHLANYSINKDSEDFVENDGEEEGSSKRKKTPTLTLTTLTLTLIGDLFCGLTLTLIGDPFCGLCNIYKKRKVAQRPRGSGHESQGYASKRYNKHNILHFPFAAALEYPIHKYGIQGSPESPNPAWPSPMEGSGGSADATTRV